MGKGPYKMKGSPMQRNFGIGSPLHQDKLTPSEIKASKKHRDEIFITPTLSELEVLQKKQVKNDPFYTIGEPNVHDPMPNISFKTDTTSKPVEMPNFTGWKKKATITKDIKKRK